MSAAEIINILLGVVVCVVVCVAGVGNMVLEFLALACYRILSGF